MVAERSRTIFRAGLVPLGVIQTINGIYALLAPRSFYEDFPFGRGWVEAYPSYSEHLVRDVGGLFLGTGVLLLAAAWYLERRLVAIALIAFCAFSVPHTIWHLFELDALGTGDAVVEAALLLSTVAVPIGLLMLLSRSARA